MNLSICLLESLLELLTGNFSLIFHSYAVLVDPCDFVVRYVASAMRLHSFNNLQVLLMRLLFEEEIPVAGLLLSSYKFFILVHEMRTFGECVRAVVCIMLLVCVKWFNEAAQNFLHLTVDTGC